MARLLTVIISLTFSLALTACGGSSGNSGGGGSGPDGKPSPDERWPETGSFSYDFSFNGCRTGKQVFTRKSRYCMALTDRQLNHGCALSTRKAAYKNNCGDDFSETNIPVGSTSGYDPYLKRRCSTGDPGKDVMPTLGEYCRFLKNETLHEGCFWLSRKHEFKDSSCPGNFSSRPVAPTPPPSTEEPNPPEDNEPVPPEPPRDTRPKAVQYLEEHGVKVVVDRNVPRFPGDKPFHERLRRFWPSLDAVKEDIASRTQQIDEITISVFTASAPKSKTIWLDVDHTGESLLRYFNLFDRHAALLQETNIDLDIGVELHRVEEAEFLRLERLIDFFSARNADLIRLEPMVEDLNLRDSTHYAMSIWQLSLDEDHYQEDFNRILRLLTPAADLFKEFRSRNVDVKANFDLETELKQFQRVISKLLDHKQDLITISEKAPLDEITIKSSRTEGRYWTGIEHFIVPTEGHEFDKLGDTLKALARQMELKQELGVKIDISAERLDNGYHESMRRLLKYLSDIKKKSNHLDEIVLGADESDFFYGTLYIGSEDSESDLRRAIREIK